MAAESSFRDKARELNAHEIAHMKAVESIADQLMGALKGNKPDPYCMAESIKKLEECVMWARTGIRKGHKL